MLGKTVGSYEITHKLGEGGMGAVYVARHALLGRKAAIKVLLPELSRNQAVVTRFFNEAKAATAIDHPGIVDVFDFGYDDEGRAYLAMEYLKGETLAERKSRLGRLHVDRVVLIGRQIAGALGAAHACGIVHRDLKPDNVILVPDPDVSGGERVKILDFGIAKLTGGADVDPSMKTRTGSLMGTPTYMAPEQCRGLTSIDHRADIYALGCVLYELSCGKPPFAGEGVGDLIAAHIGHEPPVPRSLEPTLPESLSELILRLLAKAPDGRLQTMDAVAAALVAAPGSGAQPVSAMAAVSSRRALAPTQLEDVGANDATSAPAATTLGGATGQMSVESPVFSAEPPRRGRLFIVSGVVAAALSVGGGVAVLGGSDPAPPRQVAAAAPEATDVIDAAVEVPEVIEVVITSEPTGVDVFRVFDRVRIGGTPLRRSFPRTDGEILVVLRRAGFHDESVTIDATRDHSGHVVLARKKPPAVAGSTAAPTPVVKKAVPRRRSGRKPIKDGTLDPVFIQ